MLQARRERSRDILGTHCCSRSIQPARGRPQWKWPLRVLRRRLMRHLRRHPTPQRPRAQPHRPSAGGDVACDAWPLRSGPAGLRPRTSERTRESPCSPLNYGTKLLSIMLSVKLHSESEGLPLYEQVATEIRRAIADRRSKTRRKASPSTRPRGGARGEREHGLQSIAVAARRRIVGVPAGTRRDRHRRRNRTRSCLVTSPRPPAFRPTPGVSPRRADSDHREPLGLSVSALDGRRPA